MPDTLSLWPDGSSDRRDEAEFAPTLTRYEPSGIGSGAGAGSGAGSEAVGVESSAASITPRPAIIVCPGGGYHKLAEHEGAPFAEMFARWGAVGFVLAYRHGENRFPLPMADAARAVRRVRAGEASGTLAIDPNRVAMMGFSAGGHLAATTATHPELHRDPHDPLVDRVHCRPDLLILGYPVISFVSHTHENSVRNLLGERDTLRARRRLSNELHVTADNPPTFIFHTCEDPAVPIAHALGFAAALSDREVPCELHAFERGRHGLGMAGDDPALAVWPDLLHRWIARHWPDLTEPT